MKVKVAFAIGVYLWMGSWLVGPDVHALRWSEELVKRYRRETQKEVWQEEEKPRLMQRQKEELRRLEELKAFKEDVTSKVAFPVVEIEEGNRVVIHIEGSDISIRLIGVEAEGKRFLSHLLQGELVWLEYEEKTDEAYLYRFPDGLFINLELIRQGHAYVYTVDPFKYEELFYYYERKARHNQKGLWGNIPYPDEQRQASSLPGAAYNRIYQAVAIVLMIAIATISGYEVGRRRRIKDKEHTS